MQLGVLYMVDMLPGIISCQSGGPSRQRCAGVSSTSFRENFLEILARLMLVLTFKWILPYSGKKVSDGVSITLERIKDSIAFSFLFIGSFSIKF
jgi:hypothetical protein